MISFTRVAPSTVVKPATTELKRLSEFCLSAAVNAGVVCDGVASAVSVERLKEYRPIRVLRGVSCASKREDHSASRKGAGAEVCRMLSVVKSRAPV